MRATCHRYAVREVGPIAAIRDGQSVKSAETGKPGRPSAQRRRGREEPRQEARRLEAPPSARRHARSAAFRERPRYGANAAPMAANSGPCFRRRCGAPSKSRTPSDETTRRVSSYFPSTRPRREPSRSTPQSSSASNVQRQPLSDATKRSRDKKQIGRCFPLDPYGNGEDSPPFMAGPKVMTKSVNCSPWIRM